MKTRSDSARKNSMKKNIFILIILFITLLAIGYLFVLPTMKQDALKEKQEELAKSLGVKIQDYPYQSDFPAGYFYTVLKPNMTYDEVHSIVRGYESVYNCYGTDELYYYFNKDANNALRFALYYDEQGHFVEMQGEDPNSRTLSLGSECS